MDAIRIGRRDEVFLGGGLLDLDLFSSENE